MNSTTFVVLAFALLLFVATGSHSRQRNRMKKSKEILDRYNPERSKRPLGL